MLKLEKERYCENCTHFESEVIEKPQEFYADGELIYTSGDTVVGCKYRYICKRVYEFARGGV